MNEKHQTTRELYRVVIDRTRCQIVRCPRRTRQQLNPGLAKLYKRVVQASLPSAVESTTLLSMTSEPDFDAVVRFTFELAVVIWQF